MERVIYEIVDRLDATQPVSYEYILDNIKDLTYLQYLALTRRDITHGTWLDRIMAL
jgi:hypothetical protein